MLAVAAVLTCIALTIAAVRLSPPWAIVLLTISSHIDLSGPTFDAQGSFGTLNILVSFVPPAALALRLGLLRARWTLSAVLLVAYIFTFLFHAGIPDNFVVGAVKYVAYIALFGLIGFSAIVVHRDFDLLRPVYLRTLTYAPLLLALLQSFALGGAFGTADGRFTSFSSPQSFALYCLGVAALALGSRIGLRIKLELVGVLFLAVLASGSRSALFGAVIMGTIWLVGQAFSTRRGTALFAATASLFFFVVAALIVAYPELIAVGRSTDALRELLSGRGDLTTIGTFDFRTNVAATALSLIASAGTIQFFFGSGFGGAAMAVLQTGSRATIESIDPNRALHNEYLRVMLESGVLGTVLLWGALFSMLLYTASRGWSPAVLYVSGPVVVGLLLENTLVGSASPSGWAAMLALTASAANLNEPVRQRASRKQQLKVDKW